MAVMETTLRHRKCVSANVKISVMQEILYLERWLRVRIVSHAGPAKLSYGRNVK